MEKVDMSIMGAVLKVIFGTDTSCREIERVTSDELIARAERKVADLDKVLGERPSRNIDEALRQTSGSDR